MASRWRGFGITRRKGKRRTTDQVTCYDPRRRRKANGRSFHAHSLAKEHARKFELYINGAGPPPEPALQPEPKLESEPTENPSSEPALRSCPF